MPWLSDSLNLSSLSKTVVDMFGKIGWKLFCPRANEYPGGEVCFSGLGVGGSYGFFLAEPNKCLA